MFLKKNPVRDYILITLGVVLMSIAIKNIYDAENMVTGGVSGLAIIIKSVTRVPLWVSNTVINIPLFIAGYYTKGWKFIKRTVYATLMTSVALVILPEGAFIPSGDYFLAAVFGGILMGVGSGLVFTCLATTGGTDLMAAIIQTKLRHLSLPSIMQVLDSLIVILGIGMFGLERALYSVISIYIFSKLSNNIIDGMNFAKGVYIISAHSQEIADQIMKDLDRGVTGIQARGMYKDESKEMLYCVVSRREIAILRDIVHEHDKDAFVIVSDVREVHGEGFTFEHT